MWCEVNSFMNNKCLVHETTNITNNNVEFQIGNLKEINILQDVHSLPLTAVTQPSHLNRLTLSRISMLVECLSCVLAITSAGAIRQELRNSIYENTCFHMLRFLFIWNTFARPASPEFPLSICYVRFIDCNIDSPAQHRSIQCTLSVPLTTAHHRNNKRSRMEGVGRGVVVKRSELILSWIEVLAGGVVTGKSNDICKNVVSVNSSMSSLIRLIPHI